MAHPGFLIGGVLRRQGGSKGLIFVSRHVRNESDVSNRLQSIRDGLAQTIHYLAGMGVRNAVRFAWADLRGIRDVREVRIGGFRMCLRTASSDFRVADGILRRGEYAPALRGRARTILDVGANIGASAIYFAAHCPEATVYAFEPEAENFEMLRRNVRDWPRIVPIRQAVWSQNTAREVQSRKTGAWGYTLADVADRGGYGLGQMVECVTISEFMRQRGLDKIDVLKMDIEGGEKEIFEHPEEWLGRVDLLVVELHDRICPGCTAAFDQAVRGFAHRRSDGEKVVVWRNGRP